MDALKLSRSFCARSIARGVKGLATSSRNCAASASPLAAARSYQAQASARSLVVPEPAATNAARLDWAWVLPFIAACRNHLAASAWPTGVPRPSLYMMPKLHMACSFPCSADLRNHWTALARSASTPTPWSYM